MIQTIGFSQFCDGFSGSYKNNFTFYGKHALFDYMEQYEEDCGEKIEFDPIALCCEYSEYSSAVECQEDKQYSFEYSENATDEERESEALEYLKDNTQVIEFDGGIIIQDF